MMHFHNFLLVFELSSACSLEHYLMISRTIFAMSLSTDLMDGMKDCFGRKSDVYTAVNISPE